ncbi:hypothetical protein SDC9_53361 [bioreactor metagenome]|uniref:Uncharacterized protein n=1 Tax=bioreactor metagenome TaxID=1076179 RepID=A0A644WTP3_9ZZZZ
MKKKRINHKSTIFKPNTKLYLLLSSIFGIVVIASFIALCVNIEITPICTILSAVISVFGGAFASVIVAWLIDIAACKRRNTDLSYREKQSLDYIAMFLDELFQSFADNQSSCETSDSARWEVWFRHLESNNFFKEEPDFYQRMLTTYVSLNDIVKIINELNSGELKEYIIQNNSDVLGELSILSDACCRLRDTIFNDKSENIDHIIFCINDVISTILPFYKLSTKEYIPYIESKVEKAHIIEKTP